MNLECTSSNDSVESVATSSGPTVEVLATALRIHDLSIERPAIVAYLRTVMPEKQEIALIHALEVGITEMMARRERFRH